MSTPQSTARPGRPTKFSPELAATICLRLSNGETLRQICNDPTMPCRATVCLWLSEKPEFSDQYARARDLQQDYRADEILEIADAAEDAHLAKLRIDARKWLMSKTAPKKYGDRVTNIHEGGDKPIETQDTTLRDTARRIGFVLAAADRQKKD